MALASTTPGRREIASSVASLLLLVLGIFSSAWHWTARAPLHLSDFAIFYYAARQSGHRMYEPAGRELNPPHFHLIIEPFTWLPLNAAAYVWLISGALVAIVCLWWIARTRQERWSLLDVAALSLWMPTASMLITNEVTWLLWPPLVFAWWSWRKNAWTLGALGFGVALSLKPFLGLFGLWLVIRGQWRASIVAGATCVAAFAIGSAVYGVDAYNAWLRTLEGISWSWGSMNASLLGLLARTFTPSSPYLPLVNAAQFVQPVWGVTGATVAVLSLWRSRMQTVDASWVTLMTASLLVSPLGWLYYGWWILPGMRPSKVIRIAPMWCLPLLLTRLGQPSGWWTLIWASAYTWGALLIWTRALTSDGSPWRLPGLGWLTRENFGTGSPPETPIA